MRLPHYTLAVLVSLAITGCAARTTTATMPVADVPVGVASPPANLLPGTNYRGLWLGSHGDYSCCWTSAKTAITAIKPWPSGKMDLVFFVPEPDKPDSADPNADPGRVQTWRFYHTHAFDAIVSLHDGGVTRRCCFGPGYHSITVDLPPRYLRYVGPLDFQLSTTRAFIPREVGLGPDQRLLGLFLVRVFFEKVER